MIEFVLSIGFAIVIAYSGNNAEMITDETDISVVTTSEDEDLDIVWRNAYFWSMGSDYVYIDSDGKIYMEGEMEEPLWRPSGACDKTYTGKQFTKEELDEFLSIDKEDEKSQKEILRKKGIKFGDWHF